MNKSKLWDDILNDMKNKHHEMDDLFKNKSIALIDIPLYYNVGDLLIYKGTQLYFESINADVKYKGFDRYTSFKKLSVCDVIVLQGGGSFGDLYPVHQKLREDVIKKFPNKRIVCLPQSIHFSSESKMRDSAKIFQSHNDFHLFLRDDVSFAFGKEFTCNCKMMPDMAHHMHPMVEKSEVGKEYGRILNLVRRDKETPNEQDTHNHKAGFDWDNIITVNDIILNQFLKVILKFRKDSKIVDKIWYKQIDDVIFKSSNYFYNHDVIRTDRLHGFILSSLLGKNIDLKDNSYGKNTNYCKAWLEDYPYLVKNKEI
ncbi:hypothetical protein BCS96_10410 [Vibrio breoganii]|uniref:polysaccharide pyruvyl transferase family protein n=1 Tax=Vibrio breoganii TaxID=553239 RepID=UPI000C847B88|nr:polysaccharide pyruvyl transferase family protein [Vibrio breoganii]PMJ49943.1 hypothetical protein BCU21_17415 [Vibrio breoganii]PMK63336.1 hypothetical protein BCT97_02195 [Vibrio breoganii]PML38994.1 hypothetical protein BCT78_04735 [Vibrio breoganii]PMO26329.1 hypothetical protein BCT14_15305 [Vibrio breoganii]PMO30933.1 hypothetical protein BCT13_13040 [Vibrio breoganii]